MTRQSRRFPKMIDRRQVRLQVAAALATLLWVATALAERPRARELGIAPGNLPTGRWNGITDVPGVLVGHESVVQGESIRTGATAIVPHGGNLFADKVAAAVYVANGFGKLVGSTQVEELGVLETPLLLTNTLNVWEAAATLAERALAHPENGDVRSVNPVVGETNDGWLSDIRSRPLRREHFAAALDAAKSGPVDEGCVGAGVGTVAFGLKAGIGTASRVVQAGRATVTIGVLVQANFGGRLTMAGRPVWRELQRREQAKANGATADGSCMIVIATDAALSHRQLKRLAKRSFVGMARTGASFSHGSGDYAIAFSTTTGRGKGSSGETNPTGVDDGELTPLFVAVADAAEEAIYNSLLRAETTTGVDGHVAEALPLELVASAPSE